MEDKSAYPEVTVDFMKNDKCDVSKDWNVLVGRYISDNGKMAPIVSSYLSLDRTYDDYISDCKKAYKGNVIRDAHKAVKEGFFTSIFPWALYIPDIYEINHSKKIRSGGEMRPLYLRSIEKMGGAPEKEIDFIWPSCPYHWRIQWGIFKNIDGYKQGSVKTNFKLLAYISLQRIGDFAIYAMILGHGDYLKYGIMYRLHFEIVKWICNRLHDHVKGLKHLIYAGHFQGTKGLQLWKKKTLFKPVLLCTS